MNEATGEGWDRSLVEELAQVVLQQTAPEELVLFDDTAEEYFKDPEGVLNPRRRDEAVGFGLDLAMLTPYVLAVVGSCLGFLVKTVAETATSEATKPAIGDLLGRFVRRDKQGVADGVAALSRDQANGVREVAFGRAKDLGLSEERARLLADAVVGASTSPRETAMSQVQAEETSRPVVRPDVLAYPSPTTSRYLIFVAALLSAGLFVGGWVHNQTVGQEWANTVLECRADQGGLPNDVTGSSYQQHQAYLDCVADVEWTRAFITVGGALLAALSALVILLVAPAVVRRRRGLRELGPRLQGASDRFDELAAEAGVAGRARPMLGPVTQRDAFTFGRPGRYVVSLPPAVAVRWRDRTLFDPLVSHELAHVRHRDVALAWLTRAVWLALVPLLALPVVVGLATWDLSLVGGYSWRAVVLAIVVVLVSAALLRSREHDADLRAARLRGGPSAMVGVLGGTAERSRWGGTPLLANHPTAQERSAALANPGVTVRARFVDGFTAAFLAALSFPLLVAAFSPMTGQLGDSTLAYVMAAALLGPLLAGSVGLAAWRDALFAWSTGARTSAVPLAVGVGAGLVLGRAASLQQSAAGLSGLDHPAWLVVIGLAGAGATLLSSALGRLWADITPRLRGPRGSWVVAVLANGLLFTTLLWASEMFVLAVDNAGWIYGRAGLLLVLPTRPIALVVLGLATVALLACVLARRTPALLPAWLVEDEEAAAAPRPAAPAVRLLLASGLGAGLVGVAAIVAFRVTQGAAATDDDTLARVFAYEWLTGGVAAVCILAIAALRPAWGAAGGLLAGVVAVIVTTTGFLTLNTVLDGPFEIAKVDLFARPSLCLGLFLGVALLPAAPMIARLVRPTWSGAVVVSAVAATALVTTAALLPARAHLVDRHPVTDPLAGADVRAPEPTTQELQLELSTYVERMDAPVHGRAAELEETLVGILSDEGLAPRDQADSVETEVVVPLRELLGEAQGVHPGSDRLADAHEEALAALRSGVDKSELIVEAIRQDDGSLLEAVTELQEQQDGHWLRWITMLEAIADDLNAA